MKKLLWLGMVVGGLLLGPQPGQAEEEMEIKNPVIDPPYYWTRETAVYPLRVIGGFLGLEGDPNANDNYGGTFGKYGYYEAISDESLRRYERWGVN